MSLYQKLLLFALAAAVLPVSGVGFALLSGAEAALTERIRAAQVAAARTHAAEVGRFVDAVTGTLRRAAGYFRLEGAGDEELTGAVRLLYRASPDVAIAALVDGQGRPLVDPAFEPDPHAVGLGAHPPADAPMVHRFLTFLPLDAAAKEAPGAAVLSPAYTVPERQETALAVVLPVRIGPPTAPLRFFAAEISLGAIQDAVKRASGVGTLMVLDGEGRVVAHPRYELLRRHLPSPAAQAAMAREVPTAFRVASDAGPVLAAVAPIPVKGLGWRVVASLPEAEAYREVRRMRWTVAAAVGATLTVFLAAALLVAQRLRRGLREMVKGAEAFAGGDLAYRIPPPKEAELEELARTFNQMGAELEAARRHLMRWNEELQREVEARTRELREAQERLLQAQKLAAIGQLGAGVAHEINNPLAGILGNVQLLLLKGRRNGTLDEATLAALQKVEAAAKRCRDITGALLRFSQQRSAEVKGEVDLNAVVEDVLRLTREQSAGVQVAIETALDPACPRVRGDPGQLSQLLLHLVTNALTAVDGRPQPRVEIGIRKNGSEATITVSDNGKGIDPEIQHRIFEPFFTTKDVWTGLGLGLSVAYRIAEDHGGRIEVESTPGEGATFRVVLPLAEQ